MKTVNALIRTCFVGRSHWVALAAFLAVSVCSVSQDSRQATNAKAARDEDEIRQLISMYAKAADEADPKLASRIWCDSSDDSLINPVGRWHGVEQIMGFYRHDMGDTYSSRNLKINDISVRVYTDSGWAEFDWDFEAIRKKDGSAVSFHGMETQIYQENHDNWCLVHYIIPPYPLKRRLEQNEGIRAAIGQNLEHETCEKNSRRSSRAMSQGLTLVHISRCLSTREMSGAKPRCLSK
jgi:ketosteroid isomerase-like protein